MTSPEGIAVVVTVRDDRRELEELLDALEAQTRAPDQVVVVDGGSTDGTLELLARRGVTVIEAPGANISQGRNRGIAAAAYERIACTDAGCRPVLGWLAALDAALAEVDFAGGVYRVDARTPFERALAVALYPSPDEVGGSDPLTALSHRIFGRNFDVALSTGRSMAFTRAAWRAGGTFPEDLYAGEDVSFSSAVVASGVPARLVREAEVAWRPRTTWAANARMYVIYARGDVRRGRQRRSALRAAAWLGAAAIALAGSRAQRTGAGLAALAYLGLPLARARRAGMPPGEWWRIPLVVAMKDLAQCAGAAQGVVDAARGRSQPSPR
jgi:glycosyltransferase involved in cell wall biosynthesis